MDAKELPVDYYRNIWVHHTFIIQRIMLEKLVLTEEEGLLFVGNLMLLGKFVMDEVSAHCDNPSMELTKCGLGIFPMIFPKLMEMMTKHNMIDMKREESENYLNTIMLKTRDGEPTVDDLCPIFLDKKWISDEEPVAESETDAGVDMKAEVEAEVEEAEVEDAEIEKDCSDEEEVTV